MVSFIPISAYKEKQLNIEAGWKDDKDNCFLLYLPIENEWYYSTGNESKAIERVYMRKSTARKADEMLNSGELEL